MPRRGSPARASGRGASARTPPSSLAEVAALISLATSRSVAVPRDSRSSCESRMPNRRSRAATNWIRPSESTPRSASVSSASAAAISGDGSTSESAARTSDRYSNDVLAAASTMRTKARRFSWAARSPEGLPDPPLLHLAGDAAWQVLQEVHALRHLEPCQEARAVRPQLLSGHLPRGDHGRHDALPCKGVRQPDHRGLLDAGMGQKDLLYLAGADVHPGADDEVLLPVGDLQVALRVEVADIPGPELPAPRGRGGGLRIAEVGGHEVGGPNHDLPGRPWRKLAAVVVQDAQAAVRG